MLLQCAKGVLEVGNLFLAAHNLDHIVTANNPQLWTKGAQHPQVYVPNAIEHDGVGFLKDEMVFYHSICFKLYAKIMLSAVKAQVLKEVSTVRLHRRGGTSERRRRDGTT